LALGGASGGFAVAATAGNLSCERTMKTRVLRLLVFGGLCPLFAVLRAAPATDVKLTRLDDRVRVEIGGQLFTEYVFGDGASRSYCYPILAPDGTNLMRDFPMKKDTGDDTDHPWHRSLWFAHSMMNGVDFWNEGAGDAARAGPNKGHTVLDGAVETTSGATGVIRARDRWLAPDGKLICTDDRTVRFQAAVDGRFIDFEVTLHALPDAPLLMGDNKDGVMGTRVAQWMTMPHSTTVRGADGKSAKQQTGGQGHLISSKGDKDGDVFGKRADWCDYHADHAGKTYGIAIFDHPQNVRHPTWWQARDYGLFGANPFGWHDYEAEFKNEPHKGDYTIPAGGSLTLRYRLFFHLGDEKAAHVAERYAEYAAGK
jgi:hypothetical protein